MANNTDYVTEMPVGDHHLEQEVKSYFDPNTSMMVMTWVVFFLLLAILYKFAWKPILTALDNREELLRKSIDEADQVKAELAKIEETRTKILAEAETQAKEIITESRQAAQEAAANIQHKAKEEAQILLENAQREIKESLNKTKAELRQESAEIAVKLASKLIEENLDDAKNKKLVDSLIKDIS